MRPPVREGDLDILVATDGGVGGHDQAVAPVDSDWRAARAWRATETTEPAARSTASASWSEKAERWWTCRFLRMS
jgi:hypothetical protein